MRPHACMDKGATRRLTCDNCPKMIYTKGRFKSINLHATKDSPKVVNLHVTFTAFRREDPQSQIDPPLKSLLSKDLRRSHQHSLSCIHVLIIASRGGVAFASGLICRMAAS
jgi:hypothetical protein